MTNKLTEQEINKALAEAMGHKSRCVCEIPQMGDLHTVKCVNNALKSIQFNYQDPNIFYDCLEWLLDNEFDIFKTENGCDSGIGYCCMHGDVIIPTCDKSLKKTVALAYIRAHEDE